jgi:molybdopterin-synthase adenylyltransferase
MRTRDDWRETVMRGVRELGSLRGVRHVQLGDGTRALEGQLTVADRTVTIAIHVDSILRNELPRVFLRPWDALGFIPHVDPSGLVCYLDKEGLLLDRRRPVDIVRDALKEVRRTLEDGLSGANQHDFVDELDVYWQYLPGCVQALSTLEPVGTATTVVIAEHRDPRVPPRLVMDAPDVPRVPSTGGSAGPWSAAPALLVPLAPRSAFIPPRPDRPFWDVAAVRRLLADGAPEESDRIVALLQRRVRHREYLILQLQRSSGDFTHVGIRFDGVGAVHPLLHGGRADSLTPVAIVPRQRSYLVQRGCGHMELGDRRVLLIGCGAVGGFLAFALARSGVGHLVAVDPDTLSPENTYRHMLGRRHWGKHKVVALAQAITLDLPYANVTGIPQTIEAALDQGRVDLASFDLIISALGNPTSELALNEQVRRLNAGPPIIFTWVDPLGIGGHAVLTGVDGEPGCFECLYTPPQDDPKAPLHSRASFAAPGQSFRRSLTGCGSLYTPYGVVDAEQTALLAARMALHYLQGVDGRNRLHSWKGSTRAFLAERFQLSARHAQSVDTLEAQQTAYPSPRCPVCSPPSEQP